MGPAGVDTIFGQVYVSASDTELGIGSYHFVSEVEAYISYENEKCTDIFPRLDNRGAPGVPGERMPSRMPFRGSSWDPGSRTFRGTVSFSIDMGAYEQIRTVDGVEKEEYELVFSEDFEEIVDGSCRSWFPNASRWHRCEHFGEDLFYTRWLKPVPTEQQPHIEKLDACEELTHGRATGSRAEAGPRKVLGNASGASTKAAAAMSTPTADVASALLARDLQGLQHALNAGAPVTTEVDSFELWRQMRWDPGSEWRSAPPRTSLLVATILLQWHEGVQLCVSHGADVNDVYAGPFRLATGAVGGTPGSGSVGGVPVLRLALSVRSQAQCLICRYVLDGRVDAKVFNRLKRKEQQEMEFDTQDLFNRWLGPFSGTKP